MDLSVPELRARDRVLLIYQAPTLREPVQGTGTSRVRADHPATRHRELAAEERASGLS
ncbi:hypothetical protein AB5J72_47380 [Streptomyces sp. CG1]|uniref:hypothetical protein n=1 Tax=Streptomyces sp. CG1 TaxID=1287523 RepID=UPI0034E24F9D